MGSISMDHMDPWSLPFSFVAAVPSWGDGQLGLPKAVGMQLAARIPAERGDAVRSGLAGFVLATAEAAGFDVDSALVSVEADGTGAAKVEYLVDVVGLAGEQVEQWWDSGVRSSTFHVFQPSGHTLYLILLRADDGWLLSCTCETPDVDRLGLFETLVIQQADSVIGWHGFVAVGKDWFNRRQRSHPLMLGYGPVVVGRANDMDLDVPVDAALVDKSDLSMGRVLLVRRNSADLVEAVGEIRRICWPGLRKIEPASYPSVGSLVLEGSKVVGMVPQAIESALEDEFWHRARTGDWQAPGQAGSVSAVVTVFDGTDIHDDRRGHLELLLGMWPRWATKLTGPDDHGPDGFVSVSLRDEADRFVIEHGPCDPVAHEMLVAVLQSPDWPRMADCPTAEIEVVTIPAW